MKLAKLQPRVRSIGSKLATLEQQHRSKRMRGRALSERNRRLKQQNPLCVDCVALGTDTAARLGYGVGVDEWDHEIPLAFGGADNESNLRGRCLRHHREKSERERVARGA